MTWKNVPLATVLETLNLIADGRELYALEHFPESVRDLVRRDFKRHFQGDWWKNRIDANDGSHPEVLNAVMGLDLAYRIAAERNVEYEEASGRQTTFLRIKEAITRSTDHAECIH